MKSTARQALCDIAHAAIAAVDPETAVHRHVQRKDHLLIVDNTEYDLEQFRNIYLIGAGKATAPMARAMEDILHEHLSQGMIVVKHGHGLTLRHTTILEAAHPVPDEAGLQASEKILECLTQANADDLVVCLLSGGASALLPAPLPPLNLEDLRQTTQLLLQCGASIDEINALRKHLSRIKGGRLAERAAPATLISLLLSDVIGDKPEVIASGPTVPDTTSFQDCHRIIQKYHLAPRLPDSVNQVIRDGLAGALEETPKPGNAIFSRTQQVLVGNNRQALEAAATRARQLGYTPLILTSCLAGEAKEAAEFIAAIGKEVVLSQNPLPAPACILAGGETTVTIRGTGKGGRNQELALAAAIALEGWPHLHLISLGTDGTDGPTDAAGAFASGDSLRRAANQQLDPHQFLANNDAYNFFQPLNDLLITGPTRTNVMDLICLLIDAPSWGKQP